MVVARFCLPSIYLQPKPIIVWKYNTKSLLWDEIRIKDYSCVDIILLIVRRGMSARLRLNAPWLENCVRQDCDISHSE